MIVCGEALWISCGTWIGFWSGVVGAATSALLAAAVAYGVVWATNKHQSRLAANALKAQSAALNTQLEEQRQEASKAREIAAMADVVAKTNDLWWNPSSISDLAQSPVPDAVAAAIRWRLEGSLGNSRNVESAVLAAGQVAGVVGWADVSKDATAEQEAKDELLKIVHAEPVKLFV